MAPRSVDGVEELERLPQLLAHAIDVALEQSDLAERSRHSVQSVFFDCPAR